MTPYIQILLKLNKPKITNGRKQWEVKDVVFFSSEIWDNPNYNYFFNQFKYLKTKIDKIKLNWTLYIQKVFIKKEKIFDTDCNSVDDIIKFLK